MVPEKQIKSSTPLVPMQQVKHILDVDMANVSLTVNWLSRRVSTAIRYPLPLLSTKITLAAHSLSQGEITPRFSKSFIWLAISASCHKL